MTTYSALELLSTDIFTRDVSKGGRGEYCRLASDIEKKDSSVRWNTSQGCSDYVCTDGGGAWSARRTVIHRRRSRVCCFVVYTWLCMVLVVSFTALLVVYASILRPFIVFDLHETSCLVVGSERLNNTICWCGRGCKSSYPCLKVTVQVLQEPTPQTKKHESSSETQGIRTHLEDKLRSKKRTQSVRLIDNETELQRKVGCPLSARNV